MIIHGHNHKLLKCYVVDAWANDDDDADDYSVNGLIQMATFQQRFSNVEGVNIHQS